MPSTYIPRPDIALAAWARNFSLQINLDPAAWRLSGGDAAEIAGVVEAFTAGFVLATNPGTATRVTVQGKNDARQAMLKVVRGFAQTIRRNAAVSDAAKIGLGLHPGVGTRGAWGAPASAPELQLRNAAPLRQRVVFRDSANPDRRAKPKGVIGMMVVGTVGNPAGGPTEARFKGLATDGSFEVRYAAADRGQEATLWGCWYTAAGLTGPFSARARAMVVG